MADEKPNKYEALPIPTYEEAIGSSSRTTTPTPSRSTEDASPAEREGLLGHLEPGGRLPIPTRRAGYRPPPTEEDVSVRGSLDQHESFLGQDGDGRSSEDEEVRREMEEMDGGEKLYYPTTRNG